MRVDPVSADHTLRECQGQGHRISIVVEKGDRRVGWCGSRIYQHESRLPSAVHSNMSDLTAGRANIGKSGDRCQRAGRSVANANTLIRPPDGASNSTVPRWLAATEYCVGRTKEV